MDIYSKIVENLNSEKLFVLATIVKTSGSTPRKTGAKMIVYPDGTISGTLGGGYFEQYVIEDCLKLIESHSLNLLKKYSFSLFGENSTGMCCGGNVEVFMEVHTKPNKLIIFGGGHIGKELVRLANGSGFVITVVDDRKEIIDSFDNVVDTKLAEIDYAANLPDLDENCFVVIVSRSHQTDRVIVQSILKNNCRYIGLIGSKTKTSKMFSHLKEIGIDQSLLDRIHTPIGLEINAEGPYEIAVSILAEIIAVKNGK
jgi:xanthine dehydrogenase accessory factor